MSSNSITSKISDLCNNNFPSSECEVVYFMIQVRKFIDKFGQNKNIDSLYFYCNWVAHTSLDRGDVVNNYLIKLSDQIEQAQPLIQNPDIYGLISFDALRKQLVDFLQENNFITWAEDSEKWHQFKFFLLHILIDSPIEDKSGKLTASKFEYKLGDGGNIDYIVHDQNSHEFSGTLLDGLEHSISDDLL